MEVIIVSLDGITIEKSLRLFQPLIMKLGGKIVEVFSDSRLVVGKIKGELDAKDHKMQGYLDKAWQLQSSFESFSIQQVSRSRNTHAKSLTTLATSIGQDLPQVILVEDLVRPTELEVKKVGVFQIKVGPS